MKDICAIYLKENKAIVKKLVSKLESDGISCWVAPRDFNQEDKEIVREVIEKSRILLLVLDNNTTKNKQIVDILEIALDNNLQIIPFVTGKIDTDLYSEYFFYSFSWVDAFEDEFDEAYEVLLEAIDELSEGKTKKSAHLKKSDTKNTVNKNWYIAAISTIVIFVVYFVYNQAFKNKYEDVILGQWQLADYSDNLRRAPQDSLNIINQIQIMKKNALMIFNEDNSFERRGFAPEPQIGQWKIGEKGKYLYLTPFGTQQEDKINIEKLDDNTLMLVVREKIPTVNADSIDVITKLTFSK
ncbi:MAG: toll/interleukin-1 receptor domain-containing protein [Bacteroidales bacterium]|nr:toll/interleukin-1 receptor domain-containing protein [Bacteroidales bacterium]MBN2756984.1 toll/interleukin-1 receptor domain-containing protein [Bacteroidales bacterium]